VPTVRTENKFSMNERAKKKQALLWKIVYFVVGGLIVAFVLRDGWDVSWNFNFIIVPWLAILGILILAIIRGRRKTKWFRDSDALENFQNTVWNRATKDTAEDTSAFHTSADRAVAYADRLVDRQINKARGVLPFNSIIMTVFSFERSRMPVPASNVTLSWDSIVLYWLPTSAFIIVLVILGISSWFCLELFFIHWRKGNEYEDRRYEKYRTEFDETVNLFVQRSTNIQWATVLSEAALFIGLCLVIMTEATAARQLSKPPAPPSFAESGKSSALPQTVR
jgi:hypothetical protein